MGLVIENYLKRFGDKVALNNISFEAVTGTAFGLLGQNGAGKTTTIRSILGLIQVDSGRAVWDGKDLQNIQLKIGYLPEERGLYPKSKVSDQLVYLAKLKGMDAKGAKKSMYAWLERMEMTEHVNKRVEELSKGNQQKIQLIAALLHDPDLIILDEPFSGLDPVNSNLLKEVVMELIQQKKTIIFSSHQMQHVEEFCENICILKRGNLVLHGNLKEIKRSYGRSRLHIQSDVDLTSYIEKLQIRLVNHFLNSYELQVDNEEQGRKLLQLVVEQHVPIDKYEIVEPTLHEIFIEKVGDTE